MRGCDGKIGYLSRKQALRAIRAFRRRKGDAEALCAYHCAGCGLFHAGRDPKRRRRGDYIRGAFAEKKRRYFELIAEVWS